VVLGWVKIVVIASIPLVENHKKVVDLSTPDRESPIFGI